MKNDPIMNNPAVEQLPNSNRSGTELHVSLPLSLVNKHGDILFQNGAAEELFGPDCRIGANLLPAFTSPASWPEILWELKQGSVADRPVVLRTLRRDADMAYLTVLPQQDERGLVETLLCFWAAARGMVITAHTAADDSAPQEYVRSLEQLLESRTYQNVLAAEQNEFARDALDALPVGIIIADARGTLTYRNRAMNDSFGLQTVEMMQRHVHELLPPELHPVFDRVVETGHRVHRESRDPRGRPADVDLLPLLRGGKVLRVVLQFSRSERASVP